MLYGESGTGNSGHYYVDRDGRVEEWIPADRVAHHVREFNSRSIGIELVNQGRYPDWFHSGRQTMTEPYGERQIGGLVALVCALAGQLPALRWIAGHETLDRGRVAASDDPARQVRRKVDPGPLFPWETVLAGVPLQRFRPDPDLGPESIGQ